MDFFSAQHAPPPVPSPSVDPFAQEIGRRFSLTARLSPAAAAAVSASVAASVAAAAAGPAPAAAPAPVLPAALDALLAAPGLLVLDIRPHATFTLSRLPHALSLSVPSTLLKRPAFSLAKLSEMLPTPADRRHFAAWRSAQRILVYDADSRALPDASNLRGLLRKFQNEGFLGDLLWLVGGFSAVWRESRGLVDDRPPPPDVHDDQPSGYLCPKNLPMAAFQQVSTTTASQRPPANHHVALAPTFSRPVPANPFYDNIRQIRELQHGITERIPLHLPLHVRLRRNDLPFDWLKHIVDKADIEDGTEALAMQFYMIELREQRRLMGVMDHHSRDATALASAPVPFPYSITAAVEKGSKNRYTNIWPFEHARVRLCSPNADGCDYINASHVQPLGTDRRYIATQGPLPTTYTDFWTLCWEQHIRVIVMLTKEIEGSTVKCGAYWTESAYGPLRLQLLSSSSSSSSSTVRRAFLLSNTAFPDVPPRRITHLQYLAWPDYDVPDDPRGLLGLIREVDALREEHDTVLLHCSAGIGRTGGFIVADAALDGIRREMRARADADGAAQQTLRALHVRDASPRRALRHHGSSGTDTSAFASDSDLRARALFGATATPTTTAATSPPPSVESSRAPTPANKDADAAPQPQPQAQPQPHAFDYTLPRLLHRAHHAAPAPAPLSRFAEPVRKLLEDMREQRMSLCQSLRQYVFVHRAIVEGALALVDEERAQGGGRAKRAPSPTELSVEDCAGAVRLSKRPSVKRGQRGGGGSGDVR